MKIKRKSIGGKISDTKHEIVINTADIASLPKGSLSVGGTKLPILSPKSPGSVLGNSIPLASAATAALNNSTAMNPAKSSPPLSHGPNSTSSSSSLAPSSVITANAVVVPNSSVSTNSIVLPIPPLALNHASAGGQSLQPSSNASAAASAYISDIKQSSKHSSSSSSKSSKSGGSTSHRDKKEKNGKGDKFEKGSLPAQATPVVSSPSAIGNALLKTLIVPPRSEEILKGKSC